MSMNAHTNIIISMYFGSDGFSLWTLGWFLGTTSAFFGGVLNETEATNSNFTKWCWVESLNF